MTWARRPRAIKKLFSPSFVRLHWQCCWWGSSAPRCSVPARALGEPDLPCGPLSSPLCALLRFLPFLTFFFTAANCPFLELASHRARAKYAVPLSQRPSAQANPIPFQVIISMTREPGRVAL